MEKFKELEFDDINVQKILAGEFEENLKSISRMLKVSVSSRGTKIFIKGEGEAVDIAEKTIKELYREIKEGFAISKKDVEEKLFEIKRKSAKPEIESEGVANTSDEKPNENLVIITTYRGKKIVPKTPNQISYVKAIEENDLVFVIGPAGTGKTYLAVAVAVQYLKSGRVSKLVLTRPAVEAGEKIGYLPGGILEKVDPFMRPIYDCLYDILDYREVSKLIERGILEVIPIAFMRGRTISDAFIIVDEAQNLTYDQVKMTLTRMGLGSKMILTADLTQIDIQKSGLSGLDQILGGIEGIAFVYLNHQDVVRHPVVSKIIQAFERYDKMREEKEKIPKK
ncbi:MAG: PhoH family protein [Candidatus Calescibacterium sp.]|jgi:phosphate starvation-inducible PhoH-like protein|nr:PhoH family protein [Candidatus Calescibacterium sp.]